MKRRQASAAAADPEGPPLVPKDVAAEAAVWITRLHGGHRTPQMEQECRAWQTRSAAHRLAFERCTDTWQDVASLTLAGYATATATRELAGSRRAGRSWTRRSGLAVALVLVASALALQPLKAGDAYDTGVGEQRIVVLRDGTRLSLNTSTRIQVDFAEAQRTVKVERGEALFEVAKDASRPFVVHAAGTEVVATGTAFLVQASPAAKPGDQALAVTLVEGQVVVRSAASEGRLLEKPWVMVPGQRLRLSRSDEAQRPATATRVDRPQMDQVLAWRRGEAHFDNVALLEAVDEMNRYDRVPIVVSGTAGERRVSGVVKTGDNASFAEAMASLHGLVVRNHGDRLELIQP
ncbi:FecR family protein [Roseateles sp. LYH14W]|uniref:FecR family protein n=1 Tax=Pelomonas parva TaxID=3299032 RepID=A0ABW7EZE2_9BURK